MEEIIGDYLLALGTVIYNYNTLSIIRLSKTKYKVFDTEKYMIKYIGEIKNGVNHS
jgi:hypothetical protein